MGASMRTLLMIAAMILIATDASAQRAVPADDDPMQVALACARRQAARLEPSGESAEAIGRAAWWACLREAAPAVNAAASNPQSGITPIGVQTNLEGAATAEVVFLRLCRRTADCDLVSR
jgi:hypothetical protein